MRLRSALGTEKAMCSRKPTLFSPHIHFPLLSLAASSLHIISSETGSSIGRIRLLFGPLKPLLSPMEAYWCHERKAMDQMLMGGQSEEILALS